MPTLEDLFLRLSRLARRAPALPPGELPPGLASRVLAQVRAEQDAEGSSLWGRLSLAALPFAAAIATVCVIVSYYAKQEPPRADADLLVQHLVASDFEP
jgi:hypothetical protein